MRASAAPSTSPPTTRHSRGISRRPPNAHRELPRVARRRRRAGRRGRAARVHAQRQHELAAGFLRGLLQRLHRPGLAGGAAGRREPVRPVAADGHDGPARQRLLRGRRGATCPAATGSAPDMAFFRLYRAAVVLQDDSEPQFTSVPAGPLLAPGALGGTQTATFTVADTGSGAYRPASRSTGVPCRRRRSAARCRSRRPFRARSRRPPPSRWTPRRSRTVPIASGSWSPTRRRPTSPPTARWRSRSPTRPRAAPRRTPPT